MGVRNTYGLLFRLRKVLARMVDRAVVLAARKTLFFRDEVLRCDRLYSGDVTQPDPDGI